MAVSSPKPTVFLALLAAALLAGCTTVETQSFNVVKNTNVESAHIAVDADFSKYDRLQALDMGIFFPSNAALSPADAQQLRQIFREAFRSRLGDYSVSREPGPTTMAVQASLVDLRGGGDVPALSRDIRDIATSGSLVFLMELKDSESGKVLARAADSARTPTFASGGAATDWTSVEEAAQHWADLFVGFLDANLGR